MFRYLNPGDLETLGMKSEFNIFKILWQGFLDYKLTAEAHLIIGATLAF